MLLSWFVVYHDPLACLDFTFQPFERPLLVSYRTIPYHTIPYHTILYHTIPYHTIPYHTIPYHTIPYNVRQPHLIKSIPYHTPHNEPHHTTPHTTPHYTTPHHACLTKGYTLTPVRSTCRGGSASRALFMSLSPHPTNATLPWRSNPPARARWRCVSNGRCTESSPSSLIDFCVVFTWR